MKLSEKTVKTSWHCLLAALAVFEFTQSKTPFRKMLCGGCAGWHAAAAIVDATDDGQEFLDAT